MEEDITRIYDEYEEQILFCKFFIAENLNHKPEMGRCGENILIKSLSKRFSMLEFISGFVIVDGKQSPQCDILICRKNLQRRELGNNLYLVNPKDCLMVVEVKSNITNADFSETIKKNKFFSEKDETIHIKMAIFTYKTRIGKRELYSKFGYSYSRNMKSYESKELDNEIPVDYFVCLHRDNISDFKKEKQLLFIKDSQNNKKYVCNRESPIMRNFWNLIGSYQE